MITLRPHQQTALNTLRTHSLGQVIVPTGGGKTLIQIKDAMWRFEVKQHRTILVVAPRLLLANQLCDDYLQHIDNANAIHVHSGDTKHFRTTKPEQIRLANEMCKTVGVHSLIFTTYHSLHRVVESGIDIDTVYFDEAHNSVQRHFYGPTDVLADKADRAFFFTATRKCSAVAHKPGMNWVETYGEVIARVSAPELVEGGYILPPKVKVIDMEKHPVKKITPCLDADNVITSIDDMGLKKILVCVKTTKQLVNIFKTDFAYQLNQRGYSYLYITSATGAIIDGKKVSRDKFFDTLNKWGKDVSKKFVVLHRSILSEGINVSELEGVVFMRNMDAIELTQTIGRVIRVGSDSKTFGMLCVPVYSQVGINTTKSLQRVVDTVFEKGEMLDSVVKR